VRLCWTSTCSVQHETELLRLACLRDAYAHKLRKFIPQLTGIILLIYMMNLAHPTGFEPVTSAFGARYLLSKSLNLLAPNPSNPHEHIGNTTPLSGNNPETWIMHFLRRIVNLPTTFESQRGQRLHLYFTEQISMHVDQVPLHRL
jgi:hypothetical protein